MRYAIVENGLVTNVVMSDSKPNNGIQTNIAGPGWAYVSGVFQPPVYEAVPVRVSKSDFQRLFTPTERYNLNALRKNIKSLQPEDYVDPANGLLLAAEDVLYAFEQPLEFIELDHPETEQGLELLSYLGVVTSERISEIVANKVPE